MRDSDGMPDLASHGLQRSRRPKRPDSGPRTVAAVLDRWVRDEPDRLALVGRSGRYSYAELDREVARAAGALHGLGLRPGDRLAACLPNDVEIVVAFLAAARLGLLWVGVNRALAPPEKAYMIADSGASTFLATPGVIEEIHNNSKQIPELRQLVAVGSHARNEVNSHQSVPDWSDLLERSDAGGVPDLEIDPFAPAAIAYTSGTTGFPKGAVHSQHNLLLPGAVVAHTAEPQAQLRQGVVLPLTILNLMVLGPLVAYQTGNCCVAMDRIDPEGIAEWLREEQVASFASVPTILHDLLTHPNVKPEDLASLKRPEVGGADCPESFRDLYRERYGREVTIGYGMTEAPTSVTRAQEAAPAPGICGQPLPQIEITIRDERNGLLAANEVGEICVGPSQQGEWAGVYTPMLGYWNKPEASAEALLGGVYHSGDLVLLDPSGTLFIRGRRVELILRGGANVYPAEVERVLQEHSAVSAAAVLGIPDERLGQVVVAAIEPGTGLRIDEAELFAELARRCGEQLARYKVPTDYRIVDALPRNAMNKIVKPRLVELFAGGKDE